MHRLYEYADDDTREFARWQASMALLHGKRLATLPAPVEASLNDAISATPASTFAELKAENARLRRALIEIAAAGIVGRRMSADDKEAFALIEERARTALIPPSADAHRKSGV